MNNELTELRRGLFRFLGKYYNALDDTACWLRRDGKEVCSYFARQPTTMINKKLWSVRRLGWLIFYGEIPGKMRVVTTCGSDYCVNPRHFKLVSPAAATRQGKINFEIAEQIRKEFVGARTNHYYEKYKELGEKYGLKPVTISRIVHNKLWKSD